MVAARLIFSSVLVGLLGTPAVRIENPVSDSLLPNENAMRAPSLAGSVSVSADNGTNPAVENSTGNTVQFTVTNTGTDDTRYSTSCSRTGSVAVVTTCPFIGGLLIAGEQRVVTATFTAGGAGAGTVQLRVTPTNPAGTAETGTWNVTVVNKPLVTPDGAVARVAPGAVTSFVFTVQNTGTFGSTTYTMSPICSGAGIVANSCSPSPATLPLAAGASGTDTVNYIAGSGTTTGLIDLQATVGNVVYDHGTLNVTVAPAPPPPPPSGVDVTQNPGPLVARGQCLTIALESASASECGDLRVVHALPSVRTMNRWRTPTLIYNSAHAIGWVSVAADLTLATGDAPTTVTAELKIGGTPRATGSWAGSQWPANGTRRIALGFSAPAAGLSTGVYDYEFNVTKTNPGGPITVSTTGKVAIVDRSTSYFGKGWWLAGLEQWNSGTGVWIGGDGSVRLYTQRPGSVPPNRVWGAPSLTYPDSIREMSGGAVFVRQLPDSVWVYFNALGRHDSTRNGQGHITKFTYENPTSSKIVTISLPPAAALSYNFNYDVNGRVSTIVAPGDPSSRTTTLTINAANGRLTNILEPDTRSVSFGYDTDGKITSRTDRRGTVTNFAYDAGNHVSQSTINLVPGTITRTLAHAQSQGFAGTAVPPSGVYSRLGGPRPENVAWFYLNRFGAPDTIIDALGQGQRTWFVRGNAAFPGLVTQLTSVTGHTINAAYDTRGRIQSIDQPSASGFIGTATFAWDPKWDQVTRITNPEGDFTELLIDVNTGNRTWQQDARLATSRTMFTYNASNQVETVTEPTRGAQVLTYDAKGNLHTYTSALGMQTTWTNDNVGRTTQIQTPTGTSATGWTPYQTETVGYSIRNEETSRVTAGSDGASITVGRTYDEEGNLLTLSRSFDPKAAGITVPLTTTWEYDRANRPTRQIEPDGSANRRVFDAAGNLVADTTRRDSVITMTYDPLNRLSTRRIPPVTYDPQPTQIYPPEANPQPFSYAWTVDNQAFQYSPDGQITVATNKDATVTRAYHAGGALMKETLDIKKWDRLSSHSYTTSYTYDRNGRRSTMAAPSQFAGDLIRYQYWFWGPINTLTNIASNTFAIWYDEPGEVRRIDFGGSISQAFAYDGDGRPRSDVITNGGSQTFPYYPALFLRNFSVSNRNARGQILDSSEPSQSDRVKATYSGLGYVTTSNLHQDLFNVSTGNVAAYASGDNYSYDGLGNIINTLFADSIWNPGVFQTSSHTGGNAYSTNGRLDLHQSDQFVTAYSYDASGNTYFERTNDGVHYTAERAAYFAPDESIVASDTRGYGRTRTFEEYRYDALGRRVWVRSIKTCEPSGQSVQCNIPFVRRTVWDGSQELAEIRSPVDPDNPGTIEELDTGYSERSWGFSPADPNPFYGRVVYGPGLRVDQPLSVTRYEYRDKPGMNAASAMWPRFTWQIYWNYQGLPAFGTLTAGAWAYPYQLGTGQTSCPPPGDTPQRCVLVTWPLAHTAYDQNRGNMAYGSWHGSLLEGKRDRSGLEYMRARQYDPSTGRFTQEDPIGLAGGLNAYGFAGGDPIGNGDPFGLYCQKHGPDKMTCTGEPGDWWAIAEFLGGATGRVTFEAAQNAGLTRWSPSTCRGGFSDDQCSRIAAAIGKLVVSDIELCSALGTRAAQRFEAGRVRYQEGYLHGGAVGLANVWQVWRVGTMVLSSHLFPGGNHPADLRETIAHEEYHFLYLGSSIWYGIFGHHRGDPIYNAGVTCGY